MQMLNTCIMGKAPDFKWISDALFALMALTKSLIFVARKDVGDSAQFSEPWQPTLPIFRSALPCRLRR